MLHSFVLTIQIELGSPVGQWLKPWAAAVIVGLAACLGGLNAAERPNILWITSEDNGPHLGCYGDPYATTPNLDAFAARSMRFTNAISTAPVCAVARTALITGIYPTSSGGMHMRSDNAYGSELQMYPEFLNAAGYYTINNVKTDYNLQPNCGLENLWDARSRTAHWRDRPDPQQPFFCIINHTISHESQIRKPIPAERQIHDPQQARVPAYHPDVPAVRQDWAKYYDRLSMLDELVGNDLKELAEAGLADDTIVFYYADHGSGMPRNKRSAYRSGLLVPMLVSIPEKWQHLAPDGYAPGVVSDQLIGFVDLAPTVLSLIDIEPPAYFQGRAFAGSYQRPQPRYIFGSRSRMDERYDEVRVVMDQQFTYVRNYHPHRPAGQYLRFMFHTKTTQVWKAMFDAGQLNDVQSQFWLPKPSEELYDHTSDPDEVVNLADSVDPVHQTALHNMRLAHQEWMLDIQDILLPETLLHQRIAESGLSAYDLARAAEYYDAQAVQAAARLATERNPKHIPQLIALMGSSDAALRYWGTLGLLIIGEAGYRQGREELLIALKDPQPAIAATAGEILGRFGDQAELAQAMDVLLAWSDTSKQSIYTAMASLNAIAFIGERAAPYLKQIQALPTNPTEVPSRRISPYVGSLLSFIIDQLSTAQNDPPN